MKPGLRWRLVTIEGDSEHVSSVVLNRDEAAEQLRAEAQLHAAGGWSVRVTPDGGIMATSQTGTRRVVMARVFTPFNDNKVGT